MIQRQPRSKKVLDTLDETETVNLPAPSADSPEASKFPEAVCIENGGSVDYPGKKRVDFVVDDETVCERAFYFALFFMAALLFVGAMFEQSQ